MALSGDEGGVGVSSPRRANRAELPAFRPVAGRVELRGDCGPATLSCFVKEREWKEEHFSKRKVSKQKHNIDMKNHLFESPRAMVKNVCPVLGNAQLEVLEN